MITKHTMRATIPHGDPDIGAEVDAIRLERCRCGTDRSPTLRHTGTRSKLRRYVCQDCGRIGANAVSVERAARCWNAETAAPQEAA